MSVRLPDACARADHVPSASGLQYNSMAIEKEHVLFDRHGKAVYRLCGAVFYDFKGRPRGFVAGRTVYDLRAQHRGFWQNWVLSDRMRRVVGFGQEARIIGLTLPPTEIPLLPFANQPAPETPAEAVDLQYVMYMPAWSMMQLNNLLPIEEPTEKENQ